MNIGDFDKIAGIDTPWVNIGDFGDFGDFGEFDKIGNFDLLL